MGIINETGNGKAFETVKEKARGILTGLAMRVLALSPFGCGYTKNGSYVHDHDRRGNPLEKRITNVTSEDYNNGVWERENYHPKKHGELVNFLKVGETVFESHGKKAIHTHNIYLKDGSQGSQEYYWE